MMAPAPELLIADDWADYQLLDSGNGGKLEQVGPYRFVRPEPQALWAPALPAREWEQADAIFSPAAAGDEEAGRWRFNRELPQSWVLRWDDIAFLSRPTPFRHLAFFPEHSVHWRFARECLEKHQGGQPEVLNLFGYSGLASLVCAKAGARVTHVDASKKAIGFGKDNQVAAGLDGAPIRWICDDALAFVRRELRRGRRYDLAAERWRQVLDVPGCLPQISREANEALAIHHEHRVRDLDAARVAANGGTGI